MIENELIFVQIAAYRDPELLPTLRDAIKNAHKPENLRFTIAWQHNSEDEWDNLDEFKEDDRFNIIDIHCADAKGVCWARNLIQQHYNDEKYTLQLDSHHRFIDNWDTVLKEMFHELVDSGVRKPLLTAYLPSYDPLKDPEERVQVPWWLQLDRFIPEGAIFFSPATIEDWETRTTPVPARFYSAHFCFTWGEFSREVQHDPAYYFHGEEISIAVRAFTHGYDLYHPHKVIAWHEYTRKLRKRHWDDTKGWEAWNDSSHLRNRILFGMDGHCVCEHDGKYAFGTQRTLADYEKYAGIRFRDRSVQEYTSRHNYAPNPIIANPVDYIESFKKIFKHCIDIHHMSIASKDPDDYDLWVVAFKNQHGEEFYRDDLYPEQIQQVMYEVTHGTINDVRSQLRSINDTLHTLYQNIETQIVNESEGTKSTIKQMLDDANETARQEAIRVLNTMVEHSHGRFYQIWKEFYIPGEDNIPTEWIVWPHNQKTGEWEQRLTGKLIQ